MSDVHEAARREFEEWALARIAAHNDITLEEVEFCWNDGEPFASLGKATVDLTESLAAWQASRAALDAGREPAALTVESLAAECADVFIKARNDADKPKPAPVAPPAPVSPAPQGQSKGGDAPCDPISSPEAPLPKSRVSHDGARDDSVASAAPAACPTCKGTGRVCPEGEHPVGACDSQPCRDAFHAPARAESARPRTCPMARVNRDGSQDDCALEDGHRDDHLFQPAPARDAVEEAIDALTSAAIVYGESWAEDETRRAALKAEVERARAALVEAVRRGR